MFLSYWSRWTQVNKVQLYFFEREWLGQVISVTQSDLAEALLLLFPPLGGISPFLLVLDDDSRPHTHNFSLFFNSPFLSSWVMITFVGLFFFFWSRLTDFYYQMFCFHPQLLSLPNQKWNSLQVLISLIECVKDDSFLLPYLFLLNL